MLTRLFDALEAAIDRLGRLGNFLGIRPMNRAERFITAHADRFIMITHTAQPYGDGMPAEWSRGWRDALACS